MTTKQRAEKVDRRKSKCLKGQMELANETLVKHEEYKLDWFQPTPEQVPIITSMLEKDLTVVQAPSGCGKSTTVIWQGLQGLKRNVYKQIVFVKTPDESGDDQIGYLTGDANQKLEVHFESMRSIFHSFMTKEKLLMEEKNGHIRFSIPNFLKGETLDNSLIIFDEAQSCTPKTVKLVCERAGYHSHVVLLGDKMQCYSVKRREDGLTDFINKVTTVVDGVRVSKEPLMGYVELTTDCNMRSELSKRITQLYEE